MYKGNLTAKPYHQELWPLLEGHGIVPLTKKVARPDRMPSEHDPDSLFDRGEAAHGGRKCVIIGSSPPNNAGSLSDELYVDTGRSAAIIRHVYYTNKNPWIRLDVSIKPGEAGWMPSAWTFTQYLAGGKVGQIEKLEVKKAEYNVAVSDTDFVLSPQPGDVVKEHVFPEAGLGMNTNMPASIKSVVDEKGKITKTAETGFVTVEGNVLPPERATWYYWLLAIPAVAIGGGWFMWRRRAKHSSTG